MLMTVMVSLLIPEIDVCVIERAQVQAQTLVFGCSTPSEHNSLPCHSGHFCGLELPPLNTFKFYYENTHSFELKITKIQNPDLEGPFYPPKI